MNWKTKIESILFVASRPLSLKVMAKALGQNQAEIERALASLRVKYDEASGIQILQIEDEVQMATKAQNAAVVEGFVKFEAAGELTRAQLETLTIIAYREPITRPELEQIRGVNCALILRNLLMRGLIEERESREKIMPVYTLSFDSLSHLGLKTVKDLPDYEALHAHTRIKEIIEGEKNGGSFFWARKAKAKIKGPPFFSP